MAKMRWHLVGLICGSDIQTALSGSWHWYTNCIITKLYGFVVLWFVALIYKLYSLFILQFGVLYIYKSYREITTKHTLTRMYTEFVDAMLHPSQRTINTKKLIVIAHVACKTRFHGKNETLGKLKLTLEVWIWKYLSFIRTEGGKSGKPFSEFLLCTNFSCIAIPIHKRRTSPPMIQITHLHLQTKVHVRTMSCKLSSPGN